MTTIARRLVSTNKKRYQDGGYDLDLSYITPRIIAMGFPCEGLSSLYRNPAGEVVRFLDERHPGRYKVYNLCIERGYDSGMFGGRVMRLPLYDGQAPPLHLVTSFLRDAVTWLAERPDHVVAVHCKAGKGRTGALVCALLLALELDQPMLGVPYGEAYDAAVSYYGRQRTRDGRGLTIASQRRFVQYYHELLVQASLRCQLRAVQLPPNALATPSGGAAPQPAAGAAPVLGLPPAAEPHTLPPNAVPSPPAPAGPLPPAPSPAATTSPAGAAGSTALRVLSHVTHVPHPRTRAPAHAPSPASPAPSPTASPPQWPCVVLTRLRLCGLPPWAVRQCTVCCWLRPPGHHDAVHVFEVHAGMAAAGCLSLPASEDVPAATGAANATRTSVAAGTSQATSSQNTTTTNGSGGGCTRGAVAWVIWREPSEDPSTPPSYQLEADLSTLEPLLPYGPPAPLPYVHTSSESARTVPPNAGRSPECDRCGEHGPARGDSSAGDTHVRRCVLAGDIKVQLLRGHCHPGPELYSARAIQFSAWMGTAFMAAEVLGQQGGTAHAQILAPRVQQAAGGCAAGGCGAGSFGGSGARTPADHQGHQGRAEDAGLPYGKVELSRTELDKVSKRLRRWPGPLALKLEFKAGWG